MNRYKVKMKKLLGIMLIGTYLCMNTGVLYGQEVKNSSDIESYMDVFFKKEMEEQKVPGAAVVIVQNGKVIFQKGYGYSDLKDKVMVEPDKTLFRSGSVGKLFTTTAIMQLQEKGKLDVQKNVNEYLKTFQVKSPFDTPVTCENLLTHTSGLDEASVIGIDATTEKEMLTYAGYMQKYMTKVISKSGSMANYSNLGFNLLGYLVEVQTDENYGAYIKKNILEPLQMRKSNVGIPTERRAKGYCYNNEAFEELGYLYMPDKGAGDINAPVTDMAKFLLFSLEGNEQVLTQEALKNMQKRHFGADTKLPGMCYSWIEDTYNKTRILKHEGATVDGFTTSMFMIPEKKLGFYVATNSLNALPFDLEQHFLKYYLGEQKHQYKGQIIQKKQVAKQYSGVYRSRHGMSQTKRDKMIGIFPNEDISIEWKEGEGLILEGVSVDQRLRHTALLQVEGDTFITKDNGELIIFKKDGSGKVISLCNEDPYDTFIKQKFYQTAHFNLLFLLVGLIVSLFNVGLLVRGYLKNRKEDKHFLKEQKILGWISILTIIGTLGSYGTVLIQGASVVTGVLPIFYIFIIVLYISMFLIITLLYWNIKLLKREEIRPLYKGYYLGMTFLYIGFVGFWLQWNLV